MTKHTFTNIRVPIENDNISIMRDRGKCIKCGRCKDICINYVGVRGKYDLYQTKGEAVCVNCGQCAKNCPVGAIIIRSHVKQVKRAIANKRKVVVVSTAPSVRVALGDGFNCVPGQFVEGKMVSLLRLLGFDYVLDVNFGADMTAYEEASELKHRLSHNGVFPMFTSCCPAWVKYVETFYPNLIPNLSTCKSPIAMMGTTIKTYFARMHGINPYDIVHVSITPCTAKKFEANREEMNDAGAMFGDRAMKDTDYVLTVSELIDWAKSENINFDMLSDGKFDSLMGESSTGGTIFGSSGGVMEATLTALCDVNNEDVSSVRAELAPLRCEGELREASVEVDGKKLRVACVYGLNNADKLIKKILNKTAYYDVIEVMACPGGCVGGGGISKEKPSTIQLRRQSLYSDGENKKYKTAYQNIDLKSVYSKLYGAPLSNMSDDLLHTIYVNRSEILTRNNK